MLYKVSKNHTDRSAAWGEPTTILDNASNSVSILCSQRLAAKGEFLAVSHSTLTFFVQKIQKHNAETVDLWLNYWTEHEAPDGIASRGERYLVMFSSKRFSSLSPIAATCSQQRDGIISPSCRLWCPYTQIKQRSFNLTPLFCLTRYDLAA